MNYQLTITAKATPDTVFEALTKGVPDWWTTHFKGSARKIRDEFIVQFDGTIKTFRVESLEPGKRVVWECLKAHIDMDRLTNKGEWVGTLIEWQIQPEGKGSRLTMTHHGLTAELQCYDVCAQGWSYFVLESLKPMLNGQPAKPFRPVPQL